MITVTPELSPGDGSVLLDGERVSDALRSEEVTAAVSAVSSVPAVRARLVADQQQIIGASHGIVVEGRDIGSVVAPQAEVKVYLTAREDVRAARRAAQQADGRDVASIEADLRRRDHADSSRKTDPLVQVDGAVVVDTSDRTPDQVIDCDSGAAAGSLGLARQPARGADRGCNPCWACDPQWGCDRHRACDRHWARARNAGGGPHLPPSRHRPPPRRPPRGGPVPAYSPMLGECFAAGWRAWLDT